MSKSELGSLEEHSIGADVQAHTGTALPPQLASLSPAELDKVRKRATLKIDLLVMPAITLMYILNYLDRQNLASAKLANIERDLKLTPVEYQMAISFLFVGYVLFQIPSNAFAARVRHPAVYINIAMAIWGAISAATAAVHSAAGLIVCRCVLGVVEAAFFPGALYYLSLFYSRQQLATRTALLYAGSQLGNAFGGLAAIAILTLNGKHGIEGWRWLFIVEGVLTIGIALLLAFLMPSGPGSCYGLNENEREFALWNLRKDIGKNDDRNEISAMAAMKLVVTDPKTWLLMGILHFTYVAAAVVSFFPSVVKTLGYSRNLTLVLTAPPYLLTIIVMLINGWHSDKTQERFWHIISPLFLALVAFIIAVSTLNTAARYVAMMLMPTTLYSSAIVTLSWITGSITQPSMKRALAIALINAVSNTPNAWTPYLYKSPPRYLPAFIVNLVAVGCALVFAVLTRIYLKKKNEELDRGDHSAAGAPTQEQIQNGFRYIL